MKFEYDSFKSQANKVKHGLSFEDAETLWDFPGVVIQARTEEESRWMRIAYTGQKFYSCVYTIRKGKFRLISVRRSRNEEEKIYWEVMKREKGD